MKMRILLTSSARAFAEENGWVDYLEALQLGGLVQVGDRLALTDEPEHDFKVIRRRIQVGRGRAIAGRDAGFSGAGVRAVTFTSCHGRPCAGHLGP